VAPFFTLPVAFLTMLNRQPTTLASWDPDLYCNLWQCSRERTRILASEPPGDNDRIRREFDSGDSAWNLYQAKLKTAFSPKYPEPINCDTLHFDCLTLNRDRHIELSVNSKPMAMPAYLESAIYDQDKGWQDKVAEWLKINSDDCLNYVYHMLRLNGESDISGEIEATYFVRDKGDGYWQPCYLVINDSVYDLTDTNIAECGILDTTIGWWVCTLDNEPLPDECRTDRFSQGYSCNPTAELERQLIGEPVYHWGHNCFAGRLKSYKHPVKLWPEVSSYGA
jgi:hypothetical protein